MIPVEEVVRIAAEVGLLKLFGERQCREITIDYLPARESIWAARDPADEPSVLSGPPGNCITYTLEDHMFGGVTFTAVTCQGHIVVQPFVFVSYEDLAQSVINVPVR